MKRCLSLFSVMLMATLSSGAFALPTATQTSSSNSIDVGYISEVFVTPSGQLAFPLDGGLPNAMAANQCPGTDGWAGINTSDPGFKSLIFEASVTHSKVEVVTHGCEGNWIKIVAAYILKTNT